MKWLDFAPFKICTWKNSYCLRDYFALTIVANHLDPFLTSSIKLWIIQCLDWYPNIITLLPLELSNCRNTDFYSFHVIPLNKTISEVQFKCRTFHVPNYKVRRLIQPSNFTCAEPNSWSKQISYLSLKISRLTEVVCNNSDALYFDSIWIVDESFII